MTTPALALQKAIYDKLRLSAPLTDMVATNIFDRSGRPELFPCIIIGEGRAALEKIAYSRRFIRLFHDLHCWTRDSRLIAVNEIAGLAMASLNASTPTIDDYEVLAFEAGELRTMRDPSGDLGHSIVTVHALLRDAL